MTRCAVLLATLMALTNLAITSQARIFDFGVDSENLGKGDWIFILGTATNRLNGRVPAVTDIPSLLSYEKNQGMDYIIVKAGTGGTNYNGTGTSPQFTPFLVNEAHKVGIKVFAYTRSMGDDISGEIALATNYLAMGADGFVWDAEVEWEDVPDAPGKAVQLLSAVRQAYPNRFMAHSPLPYITLHTAFPYKEFNFYCDAVMPQDYWFYIGVTPTQMVTDMNTQWRNFYNSLSGQWTNAIKPIVPTGQADVTNIPPAEIDEFVNALKTAPNPANPGGYKGIVWWQSYAHTVNQWQAIAANAFGDPPAVPDIVIDNPQATVVGAWTSGTAAAAYGTNYQFRSQGTGASFLRFTPNIVTPGAYKVFSWHAAGSNRTTNAPITITHAGGTNIVGVNQKINGGSWRLLGTFQFDAGTGGNVKVSDAFPDAGQVVMADAIRFSYVTPAPNAPITLTATAGAGPIITLNWTDNSDDEVNFVISRSLLPNGPYSAIAAVGANVTSFVDSQVGAGTTYYYVVHAANTGGSSANSNEASATTTQEVADIIIDNQSGLQTGSWSVGTNANDKFGPDYRFKGQGTGAAFYTFRPNILTPGDYNIYEWHPAGSNRSAGTPHVVSHDGGATTVNVNQKVGGGAWNLLGKYSLSVGTTGNVRVTDAFSDAGNLAMSDAIKFSYVPVINVPLAPSDLLAHAISQSQIDLQWTDNSTNEDQFVVARSLTPGGPYTDVAIVPAESNFYSNTGLSNNTAYYYVVRASNVAGSSTDSNEATATTLPIPPAAPTDLTASAVDSSQVNLSWTDNSNNENNFFVARSTSPGGPFTDVAALLADSTSFSDTGLSAETTYYYVVRASNLGGPSAGSNQASATTLPISPAAPSFLSATSVTQNQVDLLWTDSSDNEDNFVVSRSETAGGPYTDIATLTANSTSYSDITVSEDTTYYYVVRAENAGGSNSSDELVVTTLPTVPATPGGLSASSVSQSQVDLTWTDNSSNEDNFIVGRAVSSGGPYTDIATLPANTSEFSDTGLSAGTVYHYVVRARNEGGDSANSTEANATTLPNAPATPTGLTAVAVSSSQIALTWNDNSGNEDSFVIERSTTSGGPYQTVTTLPANASAFTDSGLSAATSYFYVVRAANIGGSSPFSGEAGATTFSLPPATPSNLSASAVSQTQINLSWVDNATNEDNYIVARSTAAGGPYNDIATLAANATTYNNTGLSSETTYYYVVRAANAGGPSANSDEASATTLPFGPAAPHSLNAVAARASQIDLAWVDASNNETSFIVARSTTSGGPYTTVATLGANTILYSDTGLATNTTYYYVVRASNAGGTSANSAQASAVTFENDLIIDNRSAVVVGSWLTANSATDKYRTDYRYKGQGTGSSWVQFTPYVGIAGIYQVLEWHSAGSNRETNAPHVINYSGGSQTALVNQSKNGGRWNLLGTFYFNAGSSGNIRITDNFATSKIVIADAIKLVYVPPPTPPSGLTAHATNSNSIFLRWDDNSTNEFNIVISRSNSSGGPYNDIAVLAANSTSYTDTGLPPNTQFFYVVRAQGQGGPSPNSNAAAAATPPPAPAAPSALTATAVSGSQINLSWTDNSTNENYFVVGRSTVSGGPYADIVLLSANTTSYNNTGLAADTLYYYVVRATNAGGNSAISAQASARTFAPAPTAPTGLTATAVSGSQINLAWTDTSSNETGFTVARSLTSGGPYTDVATVGANVTSYSNTGLSGATTYYYVVRSSNSGGSSANSGQASATTLSTPAAPSNLAATAVSFGQINLTWTDNSSSEGGFVIARSTTSGGPYSDVGTVAANATAFSNTGLAASTTYYYVVRATNAAGSSANSAQASATTLPSPPSPPGGLTATAISSTQINLIWTDNAANETSVIVARSTTSGGPYTDIATLAANAISYSDTGLTANTTYYYVVRAVNAGGASPNSNQAGATTLPVAPAAPSALTASALSSTSVRLTWTDNSSNENNFIVSRSATSGGPYTDIATLSANITTYTNTGLSANTTYYYVVRASNAGGNSANSAQASVTTLPLPPTAPTGLTAIAASSTSIRLTWTDTSSNESEFVVARSSTSGGPYTDVGVIGANITTYTNTGLNGSTTYYFVVRAANAGGSSANSAQASATTLAVPDIIIDNPAALVTGTWSSGTSSADKFGTNYLFKGLGTGAAHLTFRPNVAVAGNYQVFEFHPAGTNRTTNAPVVITFNGGTRTNFVNQKINGGVWVALGTPVNFAAGTNGFVRINDKIPDAGQSVMADAIKLVYVP